MKYWLGVVHREPWQAEEADLRLWRRAVDFAPGTRDVPIAPLPPVLELTRETPNWGWLMRRGQLEMSAHDFAAIAREMGADTLVA